ncbi:MAG: phage holin family protein [Actinomycetota bacterium]
MADPATRSTGTLVSDALDDFLALLRKELELLRVGLIEAFTDRLKGAGLIAGAALIVLPGMFFLLVAAALWFPGSAAFGFAMIGAIMVAVAGGAVFVGWKLLRKGGKRSSEALDKVKEDARWARERVRP